ncbi:MAG: hypothetical protein ACC663_12730, partial [Gammaproteobacteria bacterium]
IRTPRQATFKHTDERHYVEPLEKLDMGPDALIRSQTNNVPTFHVRQMRPISCGSGYILTLMHDVQIIIGGTRLI